MQKNKNAALSILITFWPCWKIGCLFIVDAFAGSFEYNEELCYKDR